MHKTPCSGFQLDCITGTYSQLVVKYDAVTGSDLEGLSLARIMFFVQLGLCFRAESTLRLKCRVSRRKFSQMFQYLGQGHTQRGGGSRGSCPPQRNLNLQFLFYFKYIGQDKRCLIFKYIGALSSFALPGKKSCARP